MYERPAQRLEQNVNQTSETTRSAHALRARRMGIDTYREPVIYMRADCHICRSEGFEAQSRILVECRGRSVVATLNVITDGHGLAHGEAGLSEAAWRLLQPVEGERIGLSHPAPLESLKYVRAKLYGKRLADEELSAIVGDVADGRYSDLHLSAFVAACAGNRLDAAETLGLTRAMVAVGERLSWRHPVVADKHCVGGLPGNRTTLIVVPIVAAAGLVMPKTSSRAITSPAGTADTMETLAPVNLDSPAMRRVVEREGGCIVWGGAANLSPADDVLIRVERPLDLDGEGAQRRGCPRLDRAAGRSGRGTGAAGAGRRHGRRPACRTGHRACARSPRRAGRPQGRADGAAGPAPTRPGAGRRNPRIVRVGWRRHRSSSG